MTCLQKSYLLLNNLPADHSSCFTRWDLRLTGTQTNLLLSYFSTTPRDCSCYIFCFIDFLSLLLCYCSFCSVKISEILEFGICLSSPALLILLLILELLLDIVIVFKTTPYDIKLLGIFSSFSITPPLFSLSYVASLSFLRINPLNYFASRLCSFAYLSSRSLVIL